MAAPVPSPYMNRLDATKVVVFMETSPNSDTFTQVTFSWKCYREVLDVLEKHMTHKKNGQFLVTTNDAHIYKFPEIKETNEPKDPDEIK